MRMPIRLQGDLRTVPKESLPESSEHQLKYGCSHTVLKGQFYGQSGCSHQRNHKGYDDPDRDQIRESHLYLRGTAEEIANFLSQELSQRRLDFTCVLTWVVRRRRA